MAITPGSNINEENDLRSALEGEGDSHPSDVLTTTTHRSNQPITATYQSVQLTDQSHHSIEPELQPSTYDLR